MLKTLIKSLREHQKTSILTMITATLEVAFEIVIPLCMADLIDLGVEKGEMNAVIKYGIALLFFAVLELLSGMISAGTAAKASAGFAANLRQDMYDNVQTFAFSNIDRFSTSSIVTRLTTDAANVQNAYQMIIRMAMRGPVMILFSMIVSFRISKEISLVFLLLIPILAIGFTAITRAVHPIFERVFKTYDKLNTIVQENLRGIRVVKSFNRQEGEIGKFHAVSKSIYSDFAKGERLIAINSPLLQFSIYLCMLLISWIGAKAIIASGNNPDIGLTTGNLTALFTYAMQILTSLMMLSMVFAMLTIARSSAERIAEILKEETDIKNPKHPITQVKDGSICYQNVDFSYSAKAEKNVISHADIEIKSGETVGIIGGTGSSKTSFVQLIPRLYDVTNGAVLVGGENVKNYDLNALRDAVAMVLQKNELFAGTIRENLCWGNEKASDKEIREVCRMACADEFITAMPDGYDTHIEQGGTNVSGGQKQRLCIARALGFMGIIYIIGTAATWIYNRTMVTIAQGTLKDIRDELFAKMQSLPIRYFDTHTNGDLMSRYTNDTDTLRQMIAQSLAQLVSSVCTIAAVFACMLYQSIYLTLIVVLAVGLILQLAKRIAGRSGFYFIRQQETLGELDGYIEEMVNGQKVVKVFCHEEAAKAAFRAKNKAWEVSSANANGYANAMMPMMNALGYVQYVIIAVVGAWMAISGAANLTVLGINTITLGTIASFLTLSRNFTNPIAQLSNQFNSIIMALAGASRIFQLMDEQPETDDGYVTLVCADENGGTLTECDRYTGMWAWKHPHGDGTTTLTKLEGRIVLDHVDFGYVPEKQILHDVTLYAEQGQKIAFVGATGAGKTTITNLINRFYDIDDGKIRYDGININKIKKADLRRSLGIVLQDVHLFTGTVMENLKYGNPGATDEACIEAAKLANAHNFIMMLPNGYQTVIRGDGGGLSQGQRQLISIARAAVSNPPVMILDEATSSIDTRTETLVQSGMDRLMEGRTVFVIAHRLSTVRNSDVIMVLDQGRIIERGQHESLIEKRGTYYQLYTGRM